MLSETFRHPRYQLLQRLGAGGMGEVYLADDVLEPGKQVALKLYPAEYHADNLRQEFLALRRLRHPTVAQAFHFGQSRSEPALPFFTIGVSPRQQPTATVADDQHRP